MRRTAASIVALLLAAATPARSGAAETNAVLKYAGVVELMWDIGSSLCKRAAGVKVSVCEEWFDPNNSETLNPEDEWKAAEAVVDRKSKAWEILRDLRATYGSCVEQATSPGATAVIVYHKQLEECDGKVTLAVSSLNIEIAKGTVPLGHGENRRRLAQNPAE
jgi:hypothetical protein